MNNYIIGIISAAVGIGAASLAMKKVKFLQPESKQNLDLVNAQIEAEEKWIDRLKITMPKYIEQVNKIKNNIDEQ